MMKLHNYITGRAFSINYINLKYFHFLCLYLQLQIIQNNKINLCFTRNDNLLLFLSTKKFNVSLSYAFFTISLFKKSLIRFFFLKNESQFSLLKISRNMTLKI